MNRRRKRKILKYLCGPWSWPLQYNWWISKFITGKEKSIWDLNQIFWEETNKWYVDHLKGKYYSKVTSITKKQDITILPNHEKRGKYKWELDHIIPIARGWRKKISPYIIGDISNLQMLPWRENLLKSDKLLSN
ncbi:MAG: HNH endonuclease [Candidatus Marinimicrobia bacterium]|jgi:hypothetical protein|nr:HNH endonuclease [Candidatus Neomarinimicrobiota bacterium]